MNHSRELEVREVGTCFGKEKECKIVGVAGASRLIALHLTKEGKGLPSVAKVHSMSDPGIPLLEERDELGWFHLPNLALGSHATPASSGKTKLHS